MTVNNDISQQSVVSNSNSSPILDADRGLIPNSPVCIFRNTPIFDIDDSVVLHVYVIHAVCMS